MGPSREGVARLGYSHRDIVSDAGHDAMNITGVVPTAMIFVPSRDGISYNGAKDSGPNELAAGAGVLLHTLLSWAQTGK